MSTIGRSPCCPESLAQLIHQALGLLLLSDVGEDLPAGGWGTEEMQTAQSGPLCVRTE